MSNLTEPKPMIKYVARLTYNEPRLAQLTVTKETAKTLAVSEYENLLGGYGYFGKRVHKKGLNLFGTYVEAMTWLIAEARRRSAELRSKADNLDAWATEAEAAQEHGQ